jgi:N-dimethylarginine dimethylaminohydrolase
LYTYQDEVTLTMATNVETPQNERWDSAKIEDIPFYRPGITASEFIRGVQGADYVTAVAQPVAGREFGANGIGKLTEVALLYPDEYTDIAANPQVQQDPEFWQRLFGTPDKPRVDIKKFQEETDVLAEVFESNGVTVRWVPFPEAPMGPYGPMMGQIYLAWGHIWRGGSIISKMGFSPGAFGLTEYLAKWAWNELDIPVLTAITEGACEPGGCNMLAQDVIVTAISCAFTEAGVKQFIEALARTSGTEELHNLVLRPAVEGFFDTSSGVCAHPDMMIHAVDAGKVVIAPALEPDARSWLADNNFRMIEADPDEQRAFMGPTNIIQIEPGRIISGDGCVKTNERLRDAGVEVIEVPSGEILKFSGGIKCRTMQIHREPGPTLEDIHDIVW